MSQKLKSRFRRSCKWKKFRMHMKSKYKVDAVTLFPLRAGWNLHHLDLDEKHYEIITDETHFRCLNKKTHEAVHFLYRYYEKDEKVISRLLRLLKKMKEINHENKLHTNGQQQT